MTGLFAVLRADVLRTYELLEGGRFRKLVNCLRAPGVQAVIVFRFGQWVRKRSFIIRMLFEPVYFVSNLWIQMAWGIELPRSAKVGPGLYIGHFGGITISSEAVIGKNCNLSQNITIGVAGKGDRMGVPVIGDHVYIAPGARLFGKIIVGHHVKIGANAVVHKDIPDHAVVVLAPGFTILSPEKDRISGGGERLSLRSLEEFT